MSAQDAKFHPVNINLLPGATDFEKTRTGKFLKWALSVGRIIVIFTELLVIMAFLGRFKFDSDLTDLHNAIEQKKSIIASAAVLEKNFLQIQARIEKIPLVENEQVPYDALISDVAKMTPIDVMINRITFTKTQITFSGSVLSEAGLATLIYQLRSSPKFSDISLDNINKRSDTPEILFSVSANFTPEAYK